MAVLERLEAEGANPERLSLKEVAVDLRRIDDLELDPSFVKIDVEGAELGVLRGMRDTIERSRPVLMVERSERFEPVVDLLSGDGYAPFAYDPETHQFSEYREQQTVNVFFCPKGREAPSRTGATTAATAPRAPGPVALGGRAGKGVGKPRPKTPLLTSRSGSGVGKKS
jgi:hypothetical protein